MQAPGISPGRRIIKYTHINSCLKNGTLAKIKLNCFINQYSETLPNLRSRCKRKYDNGDAGGAKDIIEDCWSLFHELCYPFEKYGKVQTGNSFLVKNYKF